MSKKISIAKVISQEELLPGIFSLWLETDLAHEALAGQFVSVYSNDNSKILPRPISLCEIEDNKLRLVYRVVGKGTDEFSKLLSLDSVKIMGPLGNGFDVTSPELKNKKIMLIGGGIGVPPMLQTAKSLIQNGCDRDNIITVMGYRDRTFLQEELSRVSTTYIATDDGSAGTKGTVIDAIKANKLNCDLIYACGPKPMLRALKTYTDDTATECYVSMEERMACGIGACLACVCQTTGIDNHSKVHNTRVCADGPVFNINDVEL